MIEIWCERLDLTYSIVKDSETETVFKIWNIRLEKNISVDEFIKSAEKVHEKFPEITTGDMDDIWCEYKKPKPKACQHMYTKGKNTNTQCTTKVKGEGDYCSKHRKKVNYQIQP